jgi:hypothetical protein
MDSQISSLFLNPEYKELYRNDIFRESMRVKYSLIHTRVKNFRPDKKDEIVDTDEDENLVAPSIERSIVVAVELSSPLECFPLVLHIEAQNAVGHM